MTLFLLVAAFIFLILFPTTAFDGAKSGLLLWFQVVLPTLFPFLIITNLMERLLPIRSGKLYVLFTGFLSGYPIGAKSCNYVVTEGKTSKKEGQFLLSFCNNASPAFLLNYVFIRCLGVDHERFILLAVLYLCAFVSACILFPKAMNSSFSGSMEKTEHTEFSKISFDSVLMSGFEIITKIGGYIILFSLLANIVRQHLPLPQMAKIIICGILEITTGVNLVFESGLTYSSRLLIGMFIASFGGLSALFQTQSVINNSGLSVKKYFFAKLLGSLLCTGVTWFLLLFNIL